MPSTSKPLPLSPPLGIRIPSEIVNAFARKDMGYNLLCRGRAGAGKTTFAVSLLAFFTDMTPIYISTRVAPISLYWQFPWVKTQLKSENILDASQTFLPPIKDPSGELMRDHLKYTIQYQNVGDFLKILYQKIGQTAHAIVVIDSWDAIIGSRINSSEPVETLFTEFIRQSNCKLILISESDQPSFLDYIVDGIVTLSDQEIAGRTLRFFEINKIRAVERLQKAYVYTLYHNQFQYIPPFQREENQKTAVFVPIPDQNDLFSTGNLELDQIYNGGLRPGTFNLIEIDSRVPISTISAIFVCFICQFLQNNRGVIFRATDGINSDLIDKKRLFLYVSTENISKNLKILQTQVSNRKEIRPYIIQQAGDENFNDVFFETYSKLSSISKFQPVFAGVSYDTLQFKVNFNKYIGIFENHLKLIRNLNLIELGIMNSVMDLEPTPSISSLSTDLSYVASTHIKIIIQHGCILLYSIKPRSSCLYALRTHYSEGFPQISLLPIV